MPCLVLTDRPTRQEITILIDSGATNNYISTKCNIGESVAIPPIKTKSMHGYSIVTSKKLLSVLGTKMAFFELENLEDYDMILGLCGLRKLNAKVDFMSLQLLYKRNEDIESQAKENKIYYTNDNEKFNNEIDEIMHRNELISDNLPYTTTIEATIRTKTEEPIYTKQYQYPYSDNEFVNNEIQELLTKEIIRPSRSPYNSPVWVVPKKGTDANGKPKRRMVIDYQKLNSNTITDRYPIPDSNCIIQNLGKAKYFSTIDLESGFHQILIKESDREKTAFSINGAKYEFVRMPFGLKNAPSIFQRCIDDILREYIGKFAYVYIDDVLIYSSSPEEHMKHINIIVNALHEANMKISEEKSYFFKTSVEYLGHIITHERITVDPNKVKAIKEYPIPSNLKELRSFLGLAGYYRKFIKDYSSITKPLTIHLRGDNGTVKKNQSEKVKIKLDNEAIKAIDIIKTKLQEQVELYQPDFSKPFDLTTDASNFAIGAVLSQGRNPIMFISRTLSQTEQNYGTNEKELLAIVWSLQKLRNYLYGIADLTIHTDHQSLTHSISDKNPNNKLKRWKNFIEEFGAKIVYKPGNQNIVADALSRQQINSLQSDSIHSAETSSIKMIRHSPNSINTFKNQIIILRENENNNMSETIFPNYFRHTIKFKDKEYLIKNLKEVLNPKVTNGIKIEEIHYPLLEKIILDNFITYRILCSSTLVKDIHSEEEREDIINRIHKRAHRSLQNNIIEIKTEYFWPTIKQDVRKIQCEICLKNKYERRPCKQPIGTTPTLDNPGESISMDIFFMEGKSYLTTICRYSKYMTIRKLKDRINLPEVIEEIITNMYPHCKQLNTDNENIFISHSAKKIYYKLGIEHHVGPVHHSTSNGTVERGHSTLLEITRSLADQNKSSAEELIFKAVLEYNKTIHSVTKQKPIDVFFDRTKYKHIKELIIQNQKKTLEYHNKNSKAKIFKPGDKIFATTKRRNKTAKKYQEYIVVEDLGATVKAERNHVRNILHKDNIRNDYIDANNTNKDSEDN